jgi:hypothetical protein
MRTASLALFISLALTTLALAQQSSVNTPAVNNLGEPSEPGIAIADQIMSPPNVGPIGPGVIQTDDYIGDGRVQYPPRERTSSAPPPLECRRPTDAAQAAAFDECVSGMLLLGQTEQQACETCMPRQ